MPDIPFTQPQNYDYHSHAQSPDILCLINLIIFLHMIYPLPLEFLNLIFETILKKIFEDGVHRPNAKHIKKYILCQKVVELAM